MPAVSSSTAAPAPTMAGMSSERAMIAVCEVGPPTTVTMPRMRFGSSFAVSLGVRSSATRMTGSSGRRGFAVLGTGEQAQDALADVVQIGGARRRCASSLALLHLRDAVFDRAAATTTPRCVRPR